MPARKPLVRQVQALVSIALAALALPAIPAAAAALPPLVPRPVQAEAREGAYQLEPASVIRYASEAARAEAETLAGMLRPATGLPLPVQQADENRATSNRGSITLRLDPAQEGALGREGYRLECDPASVRITAAAPAGLFYGGQTLRQLLPPAIFAATVQAGVAWTVPCCAIQDKPRFAWRGYLLDYSRHFFTLEYTKHLLDGLALNKINLFQMHLTDDDGWRIEIKKYPKLTEVGAWRGTACPLPNTRPGETHARYGGFFTQAQIREIVAYAARLHIDVMPEVDVPGHSLAIVTAYPETAPSKAPALPNAKSGRAVVNNTISPAKEANYAMVDDIMAEVAALFPFEYVHVGGDEVNFKLWGGCPEIKALIGREKLGDVAGAQVYFTRRLAEILAKHGKKMIGWNEILNEKLARTAAIMSWTGVEPGYKAIRMGFPVVMSPGPHAYFDMAYSKLADEPPGHTWAGIIDTPRCYVFDPLGEKGLDAAQSAKILGVQANLWSEFITEWKSPGGWAEFKTNGEHADYKTFPRLCALAEIGWTPQALRNYEDFSNRLGPVHLLRLKAAGMNFRVPPPDAVLDRGAIRILPPWRGAVIRYTLDGSDPRDSKTAIKWEGGPVKAAAGAFRARTFLEGAISPMQAGARDETVAAKKKTKKKK